MELLVRWRLAWVLKLQWRWALGISKPRLSVTRVGRRCMRKLALRLVVNDGFSPGLPIAMESGLVSS